MRLRRPFCATHNLKRVMGAGMGSDPDLLLHLAPARRRPGAVGATRGFIGHRFADRERPDIAFEPVELDLTVLAAAVLPAHIRREVPVRSVSDPFAALMVAVGTDLPGAANRFEAGGAF